MRWFRTTPAVLLSVVLAACSSSGGRTLKTQAAVASTPRTAAGLDDARRAAASVNQFGFDLLAPNLGADKGNVAMSPWSIATALAMVLAGARGSTATEMATVLHQSDTPAFHQAMNGLSQQLAARNAQAVEVLAANRAFAQQGEAFEQPFLNLLASSYGAGVGLADYKTAAETARQQINGWVSQQTHARIADLLAPGTLDSLTRLVLVNAVYLKADWATPFKKGRTTDLAFHAPGSDVTVPFMYGTESRRYASGDGWQSVDLDYVGGDLTMTVLVPDQGRFDAVAGHLSPALLDTINGAHPTQVSLTLPKFDIQKAQPLNQRLSQLGMPTAFKPGRADFSGMTHQESLYLSQVVHQANVTVDEKGTTAAAASGAVMETTSAPAHMVNLVVDRPFVFLLRDRPSGAILFAGQVTNPAAK
jgi:serpin B